VKFYSRSGDFFCGTVSNSYINADTTKEYVNGKTLFINRCASCHSLYKDIVGPSLMGFTKRGPWTDKKNAWLYLQNPWKFYKEDKTGYMKSLREKYKAQSPAFLLSEREVNDIIYYIEAGEKRSKTATQ
jgi:cytochrome c2